MTVRYQDVSIKILDCVYFSLDFCFSILKSYKSNSVMRIKTDI